MIINIREDSVVIEGYVNAVERNSKPLNSRAGKFVERICKGAFKRAIKRNDDIHILLNHNWDRDLGSTKQGNLELEEDNIGLKARATITDKEVIEKARRGDLVGWSFGFLDRDVENGLEKGITTREVKDLDLKEVSILDRRRSPAYEGTLLMARADSDEIHLTGEDFVDEDITVTEEEEKTAERAENEPEKATKEEQAESKPEENQSQQQKAEEIKHIDYTKAEAIVNELIEMKGA